MLEALERLGEAPWTPQKDNPHSQEVKLTQHRQHLLILVWEWFCVLPS